MWGTDPMSIDTLRSKIKAQVDVLDERQLSLLLEYVDGLSADSVEKQDYDSENDPAIGILDVDFDARQIKQMLQDDITSQGWTQKE